jgi:hypothetical protein
MKPTRIFATAALVVSSYCLITAASISVGDEPGVVRMAPRPGNGVPTPQPDSASSGVVRMTSSPIAQEPVQAQPGQSGPVMEQGLYPQPGQYAPYFERSYSATEVAPPVFYQPAQPFGPIMMFESNIGEGLGYEDGFQRFNTRIPYHVVPEQTVLMFDGNASVTNQGNGLANLGLIYRNYDGTRNRIFGYNAYLDYDQGLTNQDWFRAGAGLESLGEYLDFRLNGYFMVGDSSALLSSQQVGGLIQAGNGLFRNRQNDWENAYSGVDAETGGPLPFLGRYGINGYGGMYYLDNSHGEGTVGGQARVQALVNQYVTVNTNFTHDDHFGTTTSVGIQLEIPNYGRQRTLRPVSVRERLSDPTYRSNRVHTHLDTELIREICINDATGAGYNVVYVNPNSTASTNLGTFENPYTSMASLVNNAGIDIISVRANEANTGTGLTVAGGLSLFNNQALVSANSPYEVFRIGTTPFSIPASGTAGLRPLLSNPNMVAGGSVISLANNNTVSGFRIDASNAANTVFGNGISNALPITDVNLQNNVFSDYVIGANLQDVSGRTIIANNVFTGRGAAAAIPSTHGLNLSVAGGQTMDLLLSGNNATLNTVAGLNVVAKNGSTLNADDPDGNTTFVPPATGKYTFDNEATGIVNNITSNNGNGTGSGDGLVVTGQAGSTINAVVEGNTSSDNTLNGFVARTDGGIFNLASMRSNSLLRNGENGGFIHYLNGGVFNSVSEDRNEDLNFNGILDAGEDTNGNGRLDVPNGGSPDPGEDLNGNGILDLGIVSNTMNQNEVAGLCIFGEDASFGAFDIGGPTAALGNTFIGNRHAGVAYDLRDTAVGQFDAQNNTITSAFTANTTPGVTFVLDFVETGRSVVDPIFPTGAIDGFNFTQFGFAAGQDATLEQAILNEVITDYLGIPTISQNANSVIPDGMELNVDFVLGTPGTTPSNGATEFYFVSIGDANPDQGGIFGVAFQDIVRSGAGTGPNFGATNGDSVMTVYTDSHIAAGGGVASGNQTFTVNALSSTISHEIGHTVSLDHIDNGTGVTPNGFVDLMNVSASAADLIASAEFSFAGTNSDTANPGPRNSIQELVNALGLRSRTQTGLGGEGIVVNAQDSSRVQASTIVNNTLTNLNGDAIDIVANDNAQVEGMTIRNNTIDNNEINGIRLTANGAGAFIDADGTIEGNVINGNEGDGIGVLAQNGGVVHGNAINNQITNNLGNGISLQIDNGGVVDFGTTASNRVIRGNTITGNGGSGIQMVSNVSSTTEADMISTILGNTITGNVGGGIVAELNGPNNNPPAPPAVVHNNRLSLTIGSAAEDDANTLNGNGTVGIGVDVAGNGSTTEDLNGNGLLDLGEDRNNNGDLDVLNIENTTITGTRAGTDPRWNGDAIGLRRSDSSFLEANITNVTATGNSGDGLDVFAQGNDKFDPNQPNAGTPNSVTVLTSSFNNNTGNGANFQLFGDAMLVSDITRSSFSGNSLNGAIVSTRNTASFGDPTDGLPPGRRSIWDGNTFSNNTQDGININATDGSRVLLEVTSTRVPAGSPAHAGANTNGDTNISNNGSDGIEINTTGGQSDILITAGTGSTVIDGNGTGAAGGNGVRWNSSGTSNATTRITRTTISNSQRGGSEDANGNGVLDAGEDLNNNGDIDVANGDGIQANFTNSTVATLVVGNVGEGNVIQNNEDDGIALTANNSNDLTAVTRPVISIVDNLIGGTRNGLNAGNGGDGVSLNVFGRRASGFTSATVDTDSSDGFLSVNDGVTATGAIPQLTMTGNTITNNDRRGVNLLMTGAAGVRDRENGNSNFDPILITMDDNNISSNGMEGIFVRADADMNQSRFAYLPNFPFPSPPFNPADQRPQTPFFYNPLLPNFTGFNVGSVNGNTAYLQPYLNLRTVQNSFLTITNNVIQNNGVDTVTGEGVSINVGTGAYVAADLRNNAFGGNLEADFQTSSFLSAGQTEASVETTGNNRWDVIFLDDTAQFDLRFQDNAGNQIAPSDVGAVYTQFDLLKAIVLGNVGSANRDASLFQVDNGANLNNPNNAFSTFGITQNIQGAFTTGNYNIRGAADPLFPNIGFAPFLP